MSDRRTLFAVKIRSGGALRTLWHVVQLLGILAVFIGAVAVARLAVCAHAPGPYTVASCLAPGLKGR